MFYVRDRNGILVSKHRVLEAAGRVALQRLDCRVTDDSGTDITIAAKDAANFG